MSPCYTLGLGPGANPLELYQTVNGKLDDWKLHEYAGEVGGGNSTNMPDTFLKSILVCSILFVKIPPNNSHPSSPTPVRESPVGPAAALLN